MRHRWVEVARHGVGSTHGPHALVFLHKASLGGRAKDPQNSPHENPVLHSYDAKHTPETPMVVSEMELNDDLMVVSEL